MDVYVMKDGVRQGPHPPFRLTEMLEDGSLTPRDLVWHDGMDQWLPLEEAESMRTVLKKTAPPPLPEENRAGPDNAPGADPTAADTPAPGEPPPSVQRAMHVLRERRRLAWRRFFARQIDGVAASVIAIAFVMVTGLATAWQVVAGALWVPIAIATGWMLMETVMLCTWGTTPGRALLGIRVFAGENGKLPLPLALKRSTIVLVAGWGMGLPALMLLPLAQWAYSFWQYQKYGIVPWDRACGTRVACRKLTAWHAAGLAAAVTGFFAASVWLTMFAPLPDNLAPAQRDEILHMRAKFQSDWQRIKNPPPADKPADKPAEKPAEPPPP